MREPITTTVETTTTTTSTTTTTTTGTGTKVWYGAGHVAGGVVGMGIAPLVFLASLARGGRAVHKDGGVFAAEFVPLVDAEVAKRLAGKALVRLSPTLAKAEQQDVLGLAVRFADEQDLLTATIRSFRQAATDRGRTNAGDWLDNDYHAVGRFEIPGQGIGFLRFVGVRRRAPGAITREQRLADAIAAGEARFRLECSAGVDAWVTLGELSLGAPLDVDEAALGFSPFRAGRGIRATSFVNGIRRAVYPASRLGRSLRNG